MRENRVVAAGLLACLTACGGGGGDEDWLYPIWVPSDVVVADIDGDGRNDVLTLGQYTASASQREGRLTIHPQASPGSFGEGRTSAVGLFPWRLAVGDIDGDDRIDVVVADVDDNAVWLLLQSPAERGRFLAPRRLATGVIPYDITIGDLNGDGAPDVAIPDARSGSGRLVLLYQDPTVRGSFEPGTSLALPGISSSAVASADLDGDGRADLAMALATTSSGNASQQRLGFSLQQQDGSMGTVTTLAPQTGLNVERLSIADYDGDGRRDLFAYFTPASTPYDAKLTVLLQGPVPTSFLAPVDTTVQGLRGLNDAVFADLDGDGRPDAALTGFYPVGSPSTVESRLSRLTQSGNGGFALTATRDLPFPASRVTAGDVDGDGRNEIVVVGGESQYLVLD